MKKFGIHPLFILLGICICLMGHTILFLNYLVVVILHEFAHAFIANKLGYEMKTFWLMPYGAGLSFKQNFLDEKEEILIAYAGPLFNFLMSFICIALWWIFPNSIHLTENFVLANIIVGVTNLLPCFPLDGGRILSSYLTLKNNNKNKSLKICFIFNYFFSFLFILLFILSKFSLFTLLIFAIFIFSGTIEFKLTSQYSLSNFPIFEKKFNNNHKILVNTFAITEDTPIYKIAKNLKRNKLNLIYVIFNNKPLKILTDKNIETIFSQYSANTKISEIIK